MALKRLGIAISCYNKTKELQTCLNVIRKFWNDPDAYIAVCCNDQESLDQIKQFDVDALVQGIDYKPDNGSKGWKRLRQHDTIKKAVLACAPHTNFVMQWHADAMALFREPIDAMLDKMEPDAFDVAVRGKWKLDKNLKRPMGHVDDHFMLFRSTHVLNSILFDESMVGWIRSVADHWSSEGIMSALIQNATVMGRIWHYDDMRHNVIDMDAGYAPDPFYPDGISHSALPPLNFDPHRKFLHSDNIQHTKRIFEQEGVPLELICE